MRKGESDAPADPLTTIPNGGPVSAVPAELRDRPQWVGWRYVPRPGDPKPTKVLCDPATGGVAKSNAPSTWGSFTTALAGAQAGRWDGVGYVFSAEDPYCGIDLDDVVDPDTGEADPDALATVDRFGSYAELSPSGTGVHIIIRGTLAGKVGRKRGDRECYDDTRFFTVTGRRCTEHGVGDRQPVLDAWHAETFPPKPAAGSAPPAPARPLDLSDAELVEKIGASAQGEKFARLWAGDTDRYASGSEADLALCGILAGWCQKDAGRVDRLFRSSGLMRDKWDARRGDSTYGHRTVNKAVEGATWVYDPDYRSGADPSPTLAGNCHPVTPAVTPQNRTQQPDGEGVNDGLSPCHPVTLGVTEYTPFPIHHLPPALRELTEAGAASIGCDPAMIAVPGLVTLAAAVGNSRCVQPTPDWREPSILWGMVGAESSARKSPGFDLATRPLFRAQRAYWRDHAEAERVYRNRAEEAEAEGYGRGDPPKPRRVVASDITLDAVAPLLRDNPRGVLVACEEIDAWFQSFTRYTGGGATDRPRWLTMYGGRSLVVDRKGGGSIVVPAAVASITGTIQPGVLARSLTTEVRESGLAARFLLACPPRRSAGWSDTPIPDGVEGRYDTAVCRLLDLAPGVDGDGEPYPVPLHLSAEARGVYRGFVEKVREQVDESPAADVRAVLGKLQGTAGRLALVYALAASTSPSSVERVGVAAMAAGVGLAEWFAAEAVRVYGMLAETPVQKVARDLVEYVRRKGGSVAVRTFHRSNQKKYRTANAARADLNELVKAGLGTWAGDDLFRLYSQGDRVTIGRKPFTS